MTFSLIEKTVPAIRSKQDQAGTFEIEPSDTPLSDEERKKILIDPGFGRAFTDHMAIVRWSHGEGWHGAKVTARQPFQLDPACAVFHYGQEIFEGMKAYRAGNGEILLFRPLQNATRFNASATRLAMPPIPEELFLDAVESLVRIDAGWIPEGEAALYLRPFMFASEAFLGVRPSHEYIFCVIASPVGPYFTNGRKGLTIWVSDDLNRAGPGGTGAAKCGGNYAASLMAQAEATAQGCDQVVFLDAIERRWVEELGGMNLFFVFDDKSVVTPPLDGTILPGITRSSIIEMLRRLGYDVREEHYAIDDWQCDATSGRLREAFACGTAAVVTPVCRVKRRSCAWTIGTGEGGEVAAQVKAVLTGIQRGVFEAPQGWVKKVKI